MEMNVPQGYVIVPIFEEDPQTVVWVGVLVAQKPTPEAGALVLLRDTMDARVFLGAVVDSGARVLRWVEIWVQSVTGLKNSPAATSGALTNDVLDGRWRSVAKTLSTQESDSVLWCGAELSHPSPLFIKMKPSPKPHFPRLASGEAWLLCEDDTLLEQNGLPPYRGGLDRYLFAEDEGGGKRFIPVSADAPVSEAVLPEEEWLFSDEELIPVNPEGGLLLICPYCALELGEYLDLLAYEGWGGMAHGRNKIDPCGLVKVIGSAEEPNRLFLETLDTSCQLVELFYLRMGLLADAIKATALFIRDTRHPLLNLDENAFRVDLRPHGTAMPSLWTARASLVGYGDAVELPLANTDVRYFMRACGRELSVYRPHTAGLGAVGRCSVRIRNILPEARNGLIIEGTFKTRDVITVESCDLIWLRVPLATGVVDLYVNLEESSTQTRDEWHFRSVEQSFSSAHSDALNALAGIPMQNIPYEVIPQQSTPCDLYALGVLAVRLLLVGGSNTLPAALDRISSLAHEVECADATNDTLSDIIADLFKSDPKWGGSLGPQFFCGKEMSFDKAFQGFPASLWYDTLAMVLRMFPGEGAFRTCRHLGDVPDGALENVFCNCSSDIMAILRRTRCILAGNLIGDQEIRDVVRELKDKLG